MPPAIQTEGLVKDYRSLLSRRTVRALDRVDLQVDAGELFGLLGPNGAGKTTLLKVLLHLVRASEGSAALFGTPTSDPAARRAVGYLPENHRFPSFLTAEQLLKVYGRASGLPASARRRRIPELLELVGLTPWRSTRISAFSKGMMQRIGIAQALVNAPRLVFLDEPTDGVDPVGRRDIRALLQRLRDQGTTVFLNSHLLSEVEQVCTRIAIMNEGRVVRTGPIEALTAAEHTYEITCTRIPDDVLRTASARLSPVSDPVAESTEGPTPLVHYRIDATPRADMNALLDLLRRHDVSIEAIHPRRRSLEEYFIDVVHERPHPHPPSSTKKETRHAG